MFHPECELVKRVNSHRPIFLGDRHFPPWSGDPKPLLGGKQTFSNRWTSMRSSGSIALRGLVVRPARTIARFRFRLIWRPRRRQPPRRRTGKCNESDFQCAAADSGRGVITLRTRHDAGDMVVEVSDSGASMSANVGTVLSSLSS